MIFGASSLFHQKLELTSVFALGSKITSLSAVKVLRPSAFAKKLLAAIVQVLQKDGAGGSEHSLASLQN